MEWTPLFLLFRCAPSLLLFFLVILRRKNGARAPDPGPIRPFWAGPPSYTDKLVNALSSLCRLLCSCPHSGSNPPQLGTTFDVQKSGFLPQRGKAAYQPRCFRSLYLLILQVAPSSFPSTCNCTNSPLEQAKEPNKPTRANSFQGKGGPDCQARNASMGWLLPHFPFPVTISLLPFGPPSAASPPNRVSISPSLCSIPTRSEKRIVSCSSFISSPLPAFSHHFFF